MVELTSVEHWFKITLAGLMIACLVLLIVLLIVVVLVACCDHSCYTSQGTATRGSGTSISHTPLLVKGQDVEMQTIDASQSQNRGRPVVVPPVPLPDPLDLSKIRFHPPAQLGDGGATFDDQASVEDGAGEEEKQPDPMPVRSNQPTAPLVGDVATPLGKPLSSVVVLEQSTDSDEETV